MNLNEGETIQMDQLTPEQRRKKENRANSIVEILNVDFNEQIQKETQELIFGFMIIVNLFLFLPFFTEFILLTYQENGLSFVWVIFSLIGFEVLTITEICLLPIHYTHLRKNYQKLIEIVVFASTRIVAYFGFALLFFGRISPETLSTFIYPDCLAYLIYSCKFEMTKMKVMNLFFTMTLYFIAKFIVSQSVLTLMFAFSFYFMIIFLLMVLCTSYLVAIIFALKLYIWAPGQLNLFYPDLANGFWKKFIAHLYGFLLCSLIVSGFSLIVGGLFAAIYSGVLTGNVEMCYSLILGAWIIRSLSIGLLFGLMIQFLSNKNQIFSLMEKLKSKEIIIHKFSKSINIGFIQKGVNYFIKRDDKNETLINPTEDHLDLAKPPECQICMTNYCDTLFEPCGHYITCQTCLNEYFRTSFDCLICKQKIEKVHLIYFDSEAKAYKSEGLYQMKV